MPNRLGLHELLAPQFLLGFTGSPEIDRLFSLLAVDVLRTAVDDTAAVYSGRATFTGSGGAAPVARAHEPHRPERGEAPRALLGEQYDRARARGLASATRRTSSAWARLSSASKSRLGGSVTAGAGESRPCSSRARRLRSAPPRSRSPLARSIVRMMYEGTLVPDASA